MIVMVTVVMVKIVKGEGMIMLTKLKVKRRGADVIK